MQKAATLIIFECIQFNGRTLSSVDTKQCSSAKQNGEMMAKWVCLVHQEAFLSKQCLWSHQQRHCCKRVLVRQVRTIVTIRRSDAQTIEVLGAYTLLRRFSTTNNTPWGKEATWKASAFLGKYASITAVDLIQGRNWIWNYLKEWWHEKFLFYFIG